jgi:hypothetical protein
MARNLDAPEGIRREPQADEDDNGEVRSEGSGPQSWARAIRPTPPTGDRRSAQPPLQSKPERRSRQPPAQATQKKSDAKSAAFFHPKRSGNHRLPFCFSCDKSRTAPRSADVANAA